MNLQKGAPVPRMLFHPLPTVMALFLVTASLMISSCATVDSTVAKSEAPPAAAKAETFYVGQDGLKLFSEPRFSKEYLAALPLNEKVVRDKLDRGFARVHVPRTGQTGWVNNAHLLWRPTSSPKPAKPAPTATEKRLPEAEAIEAPSHPNPEVEGRGASIFNRF